MFSWSPIQYLWPCDRMLNLMPNLTRAFLSDTSLSRGPSNPPAGSWVLLMSELHQQSSIVQLWQHIPGSGSRAVRSCCHASQRARHGQQSGVRKPGPEARCQARLSSNKPCQAPGFMGEVWLCLCVSVSPDVSESEVKEICRLFGPHHTAQVLQ